MPKSFYQLLQFTVFFFFFCPFLSFGQNNKLIGKVVDDYNKEPLPLATVAIVKQTDSTLLSYTLTNKSGEFVIRGIPASQPIKLLISFVGRKSYRLNLEMSKNEVKDIGLVSLQGESLSEVKVIAEKIPVIIKKDTIEFSAEAFKTRPNAVLEELLKKLPGFQINTDGTFIVNGKHVSKLLIDGKQFFGNDPTVATMNLDANIVSKVQVYDDRETDPDHLINDAKVDKIINIKLKRGFLKSSFGKVFGGGGSNERYEGGGLLNVFRDTMQVSLIGISNNLNSTGFSRDEFYSLGGFNRGGGDALDNGTLSGGYSNTNNGIARLTAGGANINTDYGKRLKINILYYYTQKSTTSENQYHIKNYVNDSTTLLSSSNSKTNVSKYNHYLSGTIEWHPNDSTMLKYTPSFNSGEFNNSSSTYTTTANQNNVSLNDNSISGITSGTGRSFQHDIYYYHKLTSDGQSIMLTHNLNVNSNGSKQNNYNSVLSFTPTVPTDTLNQFVNNPVKNFSENVNVSYRYPLSKKVTIGLSAFDSYSNNNEDLLTYNFDVITGRYDTLLIDRSTSFKRLQLTNSLKPELTYRASPALNIIIGAKQELLNIRNKYLTGLEIDQKYFNFLPSLRIDYKRFSMNLDRSVSQPSIMSLQPITTIYSALYSYTGNPDLKPTVATNANLSYFNYLPEKQISINFYGNASIEHNSVIRKQTVSDQNVHTSMPVNVNGQANGSLSANLSKSFKKMGDWQLRLTTSYYFTYQKGYNIINDLNSFQFNTQHGISQNFNISWKDQAELSSSYGFTTAGTTYSASDYPSVRNNTFSIYNHLSAHFSKKIIWEVNQNFSYNSQLQDFKKDVDIVSSSLAWQLFKKENAQFKFSVYDIFNQAVSVFRYAGNNNIYDSQNKALNRYFLVTYLYRFNKSSLK